MSHSRARIVLAAIVLAWLLLPTPAAIAHGQEPVTPLQAMTHWNWEAGILLGLGLITGIYLRGLIRLWDSAGYGRGISPRRAAAFLGGLGVIFIALISPLDALADLLFSAHMIQHALLILLATPLLVLGDFPVAFLWNLPRAAHPSRSTAHSAGVWWRRSRLRRSWQALSRPWSAWLMFAGALWSWHLPYLYQAALHDEAVHAIEHGFFLGSAALFWWALLKPGGQKYARYGILVFYLFTTMLQMSVLGALLVFSSQLWYLDYITSSLAAGIAPLQDQQIAGLIMWLPGDVLFSILAALFFIAWLGALEQHMQQQEQHRSFLLRRKEGLKSPFNPLKSGDRSVTAIRLED